MKKFLFIALALMLTVAACNKTAFLKKLTGTWKLNRYLFDGKDQTLYFDTTFREYTLDLSEDNRFAESWKQFILSPDSIVLADTLGYDTPSMQYIVDFDTLRFIDTTIIPFSTFGEWQLINSDEDLQLRDDSSTTARIYRILELTNKELKLRKGNEEFYFGN